MADTALTPKYQPLYKQIKLLILQRVIDGVWAAGDSLPSEQQLGKDFGVSQGTIRKALDEMTAEKIFVRKQGKGTFVSQHSENRSLFHFFCITDTKDHRQLPDSRMISLTKVKANKKEINRLQIAPGSRVIRIKRIRYLKNKPMMSQNITLAVDVFNKIIDLQDLPNTLYSLYETEYDVKVMKVIERLRAVSAAEDDAKLLEIKTGAPVMEIDRTAIAIDGRHVEWRLSYVNTTNFHYLAELT
jgi:GntR family transcriptional regulator